MSQEKVAKYKEQKANRKAIMRKEKIMKTIRSTCTTAVLVAVVGWLGYSGVTYILDSRPVPSVEVDYTAVSEYESSLSEEDSEETETTTDAETTDESADATDTAE